MRFAKDSQAVAAGWRSQPSSRPTKRRRFRSARTTGEGVGRHALVVRKNSSSVMPARARQIDGPDIMKRHAGKKVVNPQWQPFELLCRNLGHRACFVVNEGNR